MTACHVPTPYARVVAARGEEVVRGETSRLEEIVTEALGELRPGHPARTPLEVAAAVAAADDDMCAMRRMDVLSDGIVRAQRLVSLESRASAILFLDVDKRERWPSYGAYRRDWDDYAARIASRG